MGSRLFNVFLVWLFFYRSVIFCWLILAWSFGILFIRVSRRNLLLLLVVACCFIISLVAFSFFNSLFIRRSPACFFTHRFINIHSFAPCRILLIYFVIYSVF